MATKASLIDINKKSQKLDRYAGKWVAFMGMKIVAYNDTLKGLMDEINKKKLKEKVSVFLVPRKNEGPYVLIIL